MQKIKHPEERLREVGAKLRALSHLIENQRPDPVLSLDMDKVHWGLALILEELGRTAARIGDDLEVKKLSPTSKAK